MRAHLILAQVSGVPRCPRVRTRSPISGPLCANLQTAADAADTQITRELELQTVPSTRACTDSFAQIALAWHFLIYSGVFCTLDILSFMFICMSIYRNVCRLPWAAMEPKTCSVTQGDSVFAIYCTCSRFTLTSSWVQGCWQSCQPREQQMSPPRTCCPTPARRQLSSRVLLICLVNPHYVLSVVFSNHFVKPFLNTLHSVNLQASEIASIQSKSTTDHPESPAVLLQVNSLLGYQQRSRQATPGLGTNSNTIPLISL